MKDEYANFQVDRFYVYYCGYPLGVEGSQTRYKCPTSTTKSRDIYVSPSGKWHCKHAKCAVESNCKITGGGPKQLLEMVEPTMSDKEAFDTLDTFGRNSTSTSKTKPAVTQKALKNWNSLESISNWLSSKPPKGKGYTNVIIHEYQQSSGAPCMAVIRCEPGKKKKKDFYQYHKTPTGWEAGGIKEKRPLYRLSVPANGRNLPVIICEGEKKTDILQEALPKLSYWVTSPSQGAQSPQKANWETVKGRQVFILPDNDAPGLSFAEKVSKLCIEAGATSTAIVRPFYGKKPNDSRDIADFLADGGTTEAIIKELKESTSGERKSSEEAKKGIEYTFDASACDQIYDKEFAPIKWIIPGILAEGFALLGGRPKKGKSWLAISLALAVSNGGKALDSIKVDCGKVLYFALEDNERRIQSRLRKLVGEDKPKPKNIHFVTEIPSFPKNQDKEFRKWFSNALDTWLKIHPETRLIIIDTISHPHINPPKTKGADVSAQDYDTAAWFQKISFSKDLCILGVRHTRKSQTGNPIDDFAGSTGITAAVDTAITIGDSEEGRTSATLNIVGRDVPSQTLAMNFSNCSWSLLGKAEDFEATDQQRPVIELLRNLGALSPAEIAEKLNETRSTVRSTLGRMKQAGLVVQKSGPRSKYTLPARLQEQLSLPTLAEDGEII